VGARSTDFRIKIWNTATGVIVFDNKLGGSDDFSASPTQPISSGSIVIHKAASSSINRLRTPEREPAGPFSGFPAYSAHVCR
jgi:hypothetical protein